MAELVDAPDLGSGSERSESSSLLCRTQYNKTMKKSAIFLCLALAAISLQSCLMGEAQSTPTFYYSYIYRTNAQGARDSIFYGDTVHIGDTLRAPLLVSGVYNSLVSFSVEADQEALNYRLVVDSVYLSWLEADSKPENGYLHFTKDCYTFPCMLVYMPQKTGDYMVQFTVASTASKQYSPSHAQFTQPVR